MMALDKAQYDKARGFSFGGYFAQKRSYSVEDTCQTFSLAHLYVSDESFTLDFCYFFLMGDDREAGWVRKGGSLVMSSISPICLFFFFVILSVELNFYGHTPGQYLVLSISEGVLGQSHGSISKNAIGDHSNVLIGSYEKAFLLIHLCQKCYFQILPVPLSKCVTFGKRFNFCFSFAKWRLVIIVTSLSCEN